jgi:hypothetical protein
MLTLDLLCASIARAQADTAKTTTPHTSTRTCYRGNRLPACERFVVTELSAYRRIAGPDVARSRVGMVGAPGTYTRGHSTAGLAVEAGLLFNRDRRSANGVALMLSGNEDDGLGTTIKWRHRQWLDDGQSLDFGLGVTKGKLHRLDFTHERAIGLTAELDADAADLMALYVRADLLKSRHETEPSINLGIRAGSKLAIVSAALLAMGVSLLAWLFSGLND